MIGLQTIIARVAMLATISLALGVRPGCSDTAQASQSESHTKAQRLNVGSRSLTREHLIEAHHVLVLLTAHASGQASALDTASKPHPHCNAPKQSPRFLLLLGHQRGQILDFQAVIKSAASAASPWGGCASRLRHKISLNPGWLR